MYLNSVANSPLKNPFTDPDEPSACTAEITVAMHGRVQTSPVTDPPVMTRALYAMASPRERRILVGTLQLAEAYANAAEQILRHHAEPDNAEPERGLWDYPEAAAWFGITVNALEKRVARNRVPGVVRSGSRVQFKIEVLKQIKASR